MVLNSKWLNGKCRLQRATGVCIFLMLFGFFSPQAEAEEDCHSDTVRAEDDEENESPAETDLQACFFNCVFDFYSIVPIRMQKLIVIMDICRLLLFALNLTVFLLVCRILKLCYGFVKRSINNDCL